MKYQHIINAVDKTIKELCDEFQSHPTLFYTENDIVCYFYSLLKNNIPTPFSHDKDGCEHLLIHGEYPTPFRCDMGGDRFEIKGDTESKFKRGHYDFVVLNPDFIKAHSYSVIKTQNYKEYKKHALSNVAAYSPVILYGIEFMFSRDPLKWSKGQDRGRGVAGFVVEVMQDVRKLLETKKWKEGFMGQIKMLAFIKGSAPDICTFIKGRIGKMEEIILCFGENGPAKQARRDSGPG